MNFKTLSNSVAAILCVLVGLYVGRTFATLKDLEDSSEQNRNSLKAFPLSEARQRLAGLRVEISRKDETATVNASNRGDPQNSSGINNHSDIDLQRTLIDSVASKIQNKYLLLFQNGDLSTSQKERLVAILAERNYGSGAEAGKFQDLEEKRLKSDAEIRSLLDPNQFAKYQQCRDVLPAKNLAETFTNIASARGINVSTQAVATLVQVVSSSFGDPDAIAYTQLENIRAANAVDQGTAFITDRAIEETKALLGAEGQAILRNIQNQQKAVLSVEEVKKQLKPNL